MASARERAERAEARLAEAERAAQQLYEADDADSPVMLDAFIAWQDYCHKHGVSETVPADSAALQCTGCVGVTKPICGHFAEQDDGEGRVSHYCATCGHSNECHEPASTAHSASACRFCGQPTADHLNPGDCENPDIKTCHLKPRDGTPMGTAETVTAVETP